METQDLSRVHAFVDQHRDQAIAWFSTQWSETHTIPVGNKPPYLWATQVRIAEFMLALAEIDLKIAEAKADQALMRSRLFKAHADAHANETTLADSSAEPSTLIDYETEEFSKRDRAKKRSLLAWYESDDEPHRYHLEQFHPGQPSKWAY